ncbi:MAG: VIT and VWA domain-containing protein, partial [Planctomycetota bacterium]
MTHSTLPRQDRRNLPGIDFDVDFDALDTDDFSPGMMQCDAGFLPLQQLHYSVRIAGLTVHTIVKQTFYNPFDEAIQAKYIFPLAIDSAVTACDMLVDGRVVSAKLKERGEARREYQRAIDSGRTAALLEENRPETFSMTVGNVAAGEAIQTRIETIAPILVSDGQWALRLPLVIAPRYTSGIAIPGPSVGTGFQGDTQRVPDASMVSPPTLLPGCRNPVHLSIDVDMQFNDACLPVQAPQLAGGENGEIDLAAWIQCSLHSLSVSETGHGVRMSILPGQRVDRDFILRGQVDPRAIHLRSHCESDTHHDNAESDTQTVAITLTAPTTASSTPRKIAFVLDRSGSMGGWKMREAILGTKRLIETLHQHDHFQLLAFDNSLESPPNRRFKNIETDGWIPASSGNKSAAIAWLNGIGARGGTEMEMALNAALQCFANRSSRSHPQPSHPSKRDANAIVLITDGHVTGEDAVLQTLHSLPESNRPRLFALGIDRAVNASVLRRLSDATGGMSELVESQPRMRDVIDTFSSKIGAPMLTDFALTDSTGRQ